MYNPVRGCRRLAWGRRSAHAAARPAVHVRLSQPLQLPHPRGPRWPTWAKRGLANEPQDFIRSRERRCDRVVALGRPRRQGGCVRLFDVPPQSSNHCCCPVRLRRPGRSSGRHAFDLSKSGGFRTFLLAACELRRTIYWEAVTFHKPLQYVTTQISARGLSSSRGKLMNLTAASRSVVSV